MPSDAPVFSRTLPRDFTPPGSANTYTLAPLSVLERIRLNAHIAEVCGVYPTDEMMREAMRAAVQEMNPANKDTLLGWITAAEETPDDRAAAARLSAVEAACAPVPAYAALLRARQLRRDYVPVLTLRHALRGWQGEGLPEFRREAGLLPEDLLEAIPYDDVAAAGWEAYGMTFLTQAAEKNSAAPSASSAAPEPTPEGASSTAEAPPG